MPCILCISAANKQSADSKRTLRLLGTNIFGLKKAFPVDSQNDILVDKFLERFCFGSISLVKKAVVILVSIPVPFCHLKWFFYILLLHYFFIQVLQLYLKMSGVRFVRNLVLYCLECSKNSDIVPFLDLRGGV